MCVHWSVQTYKYWEKISEVYDKKSLSKLLVTKPNRANLNICRRMKADKTDYVRYFGLAQLCNNTGKLSSLPFSGLFFNNPAIISKFHYNLLAHNTRIQRASQTL